MFIHYNERLTIVTKSATMYTKGKILNSKSLTNIFVY